MGDYVRWAPPYYGDEDKQPLGTRSALYLSLNRGKRSVASTSSPTTGAKAFLQLVEDADIVLESFRPGVLDRLGVGYETLREVNPRIVYCAITGYGLDGPNVARAGHDTNYLALNGLLGLTGAADGPPVSAAGQIADLGGGGLMAAFGILAALAEREHSGEGQLVDVSMTDGALSWLAMVAAAYLADGRVPHRGTEMLNGGVACYLPYECADGWVSCGALEPKFWQAFCARHRAPGPGRASVREARLGGARGDRRGVQGQDQGRVGRVQRLTRLLHRAGPRPRRGARLRAGSRSRDGRWGRAAGDRAGPAARPPGEVLAHARRIPPGPRPRSASTPSEVLAESGLSSRPDRGAAGVRRRRRAQRGPGAGAVPVDERARQENFSKISELAERADVPVATVRHYLREGLLPGAGQDLEEHGVLPARVRRADPIDQAAAGAALHAAQGDPRAAGVGQRQPRATA